MKICTRCGETKPVDDFTPNGQKNGTTKRYAWCRLCKSDYAKEWRAKNPDSGVRAGARRRYREENKEEYLEAQRTAKRKKYYENLERSREIQRAWRAKNPEKIAARMAKRNQRFRDEGLWQFYKHGITLDEQRAILAAQGGGCAICGIELSLTNTRTKKVDHCHE